jgi:hypothetical protein
VFVIEQVLDIATRAGEEIVDADNDGAVAQQALAQVGTEKTGAAGNQTVSPWLVRSFRLTGSVTLSTETGSFYGSATILTRSATIQTRALIARRRR